jgi:hypothetical protein
VYISNKNKGQHETAHTHTHTHHEQKQQQRKEVSEERDFHPTSQRGFAAAAAIDDDRGRVEMVIIIVSRISISSRVARTVTTRNHFHRTPPFDYYDVADAFCTAAVHQHTKPEREILKNDDDAKKPNYFSCSSSPSRLSHISRTLPFFLSLNCPRGEVTFLANSSARV